MRCALLIAGLVAFGAAGCHRAGQPAGGARGSKADAARKQAETLAISAVTTAAAEVKVRDNSRRNGGGWTSTLMVALAAKVGPNHPVGAQSPPKPPAVTAKPPASEAPRFASRSPIREVVSNQLPTTRDGEAESDVLAVAQDTIERKLAELDPPVRYRPTANEVKNEFLRRDSRYSVPLGKVTGDEARLRRADEMRKVFVGIFDDTSEKEKLAEFLYIEYAVEVTADQVRELRTRDRLADGLRMLGLVTAAAVAGLLFLRLDQWTRGHLTRLLAIAAVTLAVAAAIGLYLL